MTQKILYFTAGKTPTGPELAEIATVLGLEAVNSLQIRNAAPVIPEGREGATIETCDYVMGAIPTAYLAKPVFVPGDVGPTVENGDSITLHDTSTTTVVGTAAVSDGALDQVDLPTTAKILKSTVFFLCPAPTGTRITGYTATIVNGAITAIAGS